MSSSIRIKKIPATAPINNAFSIKSSSDSREGIFQAKEVFHLMTSKLLFLYTKEKFHA